MASWLAIGRLVVAVAKWKMWQVVLGVLGFACGELDVPMWQVSTVTSWTHIRANGGSFMCNEFSWLSVMHDGLCY